MMFPDATFVSMSIKDMDGWASGTATADLATLHARHAVEDDGGDEPADRGKADRGDDVRRETERDETAAEPVLALW
jgi:hypothetical protein